MDRTASRTARVCRRERAQATVEWLGLVLLVALLALGLAAAGVRLPGLALAGELGAKLVCLAGLEADGCTGAGPPSPLAAEYGPEAAGLLLAHAPRIEYEDGMRALPVDFRECRRDPCSLGPPAGEVVRTSGGRPVTLFTHVIDCRAGGAAASGAAGLDCSGDRAGHLYLQYWAYYPGSQSLRGVPGNPGFHEDDWESLQLKLGAGQRLARASSHHGYNYEAGVSSWLSDAGISSRPAWGADDRRYYVSGGSHAGHAHESDPAPQGEQRFTPGDAIRLVPIEPIARAGGHWRFAVSAPWRKHVYRDPEWEQTD